MLKKILPIFLVWKFIALALAFIASFLIPLRDTYILTSWDISVKKLPYLVWVWGNFDGVHYLDIAKSAYHSANHAFFPLFPLFISIIYLPVSRFFHSPYVISGEFVSNIAFFFSLIVLYKILLLDGKGKFIPLFFLVLILFPTSPFYGAIYNDSLFLLFTTFTIYFSRKRKWISASVSGIFATLTRFNGLALFFIVFFEYIAPQTKSDSLWNIKKLIVVVKRAFSARRILKETIYAIFLIPLAFLSYLFYTQIVYGNWYLVISSLKQWDQDKIVFPLQVFFRYFKIFFLSLAGYQPIQLNFWGSMFELSSVLFYIFLMCYSFKKIRLSYWLFFFISILIPSMTGTFQGMPRYGLHLYPFFLAITLFLSQRTPIVKIAYFMLCILLMAFVVTLFTRGYFVT